MKKLGMGLITALLACVTLAYAAPKDHTFTGEIMDNMCAKNGSHDAMMKKENIANAKDCTNGCVKMGGKYVLYNKTTKRTYQLDDQTKPVDYAGQDVKVMGSYDRATHTIHVSNIEAASGT